MEDSSNSDPDVTQFAQSPPPEQFLPKTRSRTSITSSNRKITPISNKNQDKG